MKNFKHIQVYLLFQFMVLTSYSQPKDLTREIEIDPRQYVTIIYRKSSTQSKLDTIWNWENRNNIPNQKFQIIDIDGEIRIEFNRPKLIANKEFEGTISLEAEISGNNGTRKIEVNPYSEVGVQRIPIGIKSEPPSEISKKLLNMLRELRDASEIYNSAEFIGFYADEAPLRELLDKRINEIESKSKDTKIKDIKIKVEDLKEKGTDLFSFIKSDYTASWRYLYKNEEFNFNNITTEKEFQDMFEVMNKHIHNINDGWRTQFVANTKKALIYDNQKTEIILSYLNSFESAGEDATKSFLSLVNKDIVGYKILKNNLLIQQNKLKAINISNYKENDRRLDTVLLRNYELILECSKNLSDLSRFKGSPLERIIFDIASVKDINLKIEDESYLNNYTQQKKDSIERIRQEKERIFYEITDTCFEKISAALTTEAGNIIYKKLIYATIDLGKSGAKDGEVLNVYVTWILNYKRDSLANSPRLPIGKYYLRETGWKLEVADMFALVKRINEQKINSTADSSTVSPSNFKGSGGAVLMWTYKKEDKGISITKDTSGLVVKSKNRFLNSLEPSIGLNVSYLDFSTIKDVEIGAGLQLGFFRNKIFLGYGINLHMLFPSKQSPSYFYLGFSFAKLSDMFKSNNNVTVAQ